MNFKKFFKNFKPTISEIITLDRCVEQGLLTKEEMLRIKKDRAIEEWEKESGLKHTKAKR